jgi:4-diphosphocytidyl-2-C-methyl-D-erythritol kinase
MLTIDLRSPAKINLFLAVTGRRPDGYHELWSWMVPLELADKVAIELAGDGIRVCCDHPDVPEDESNIAFRAAWDFLAHLAQMNGATPGGVTVRIDKHIPVAAGLGGGSSNAATVLAGLNHLLGYPLPDSRLMKLAVGIGADVPFFLYAKPALASGIGERLRPSPAIQRYAVLLVNPGIKVSTRTVFENLNLTLTNCCQKLKNLPFGGKVVAPDGYLCNDLEPVTAAWYPQVGAIKAALLEHGAQGALMSGSGPTVFGLFKSTERAEKALGQLRQQISGQFYMTHTH